MFTFIKVARRFSSPGRTAKAGEGGYVKESEQSPHASRRGRLKNGNRTGDFSRAPYCGARTRRGTLCKARAMANGRCRLHGGKSTGPRSAAGIERIRRALTKHGRYSKAARIERHQFRALVREAREILMLAMANDRTSETGVASGGGTGSHQRIELG